MLILQGSLEDLGQLGMMMGCLSCAGKEFPEAAYRELSAACLKSLVPSSINPTSWWKYSTITLALCWVGWMSFGWWSIPDTHKTGSPWNAYLPQTPFESICRLKSWTTMKGDALVLNIDHISLWLNAFENLLQEILPWKGEQEPVVRGSLRRGRWGRVVEKLYGSLPLYPVMFCSQQVSLLASNTTGFMKRTQSFIFPPPTCLYL